MATGADIFRRFIVCNSRYVVHLNPHCSGSLTEASLQDAGRFGSDPNRRSGFQP